MNFFSMLFPWPCHSNFAALVLGRAIRFHHVTLQHLIVAYAGSVILVLAVQSDITDRWSGPTAPLFVAGLRLGQQFGTRQRDDDRTRRGSQQDGDDAHHHYRSGVSDVFIIFVVGSNFQYGRTQSGLKMIPRVFLKKNIRHWIIVGVI